MKLDRTLIAVRERSASDVLDLSLHVTRAYARPLLLTMLLGVAPLSIINFLLIGWMANVEEFPLRYIYHLSLLTFFEAQLASVFATTFLGQSVFNEKPSIRYVISQAAGVWNRLLLSQGVLRCVIPVWLLLALMPREQYVEPLSEIILMGMLVLYTMAIRAARPFVNEIAVLERNPVMRAQPGQQTMYQRSNNLHREATPELIAAWLMHCIIAVMLVISVYGSVLFIIGTFGNEWDQTGIYMHLILPACLWTVVAYFTVVRFLSYLDLRIRQEGWEVELVLRAEAEKMERKFTA